MAVRIANREDVPAMLAIYGPYVEQTAISFEYEVPTLAAFSARFMMTCSMSMASMGIKSSSSGTETSVFMPPRRFSALIIASARNVEFYDFDNMWGHYLFPDSFNY